MWDLNNQFPVMTPDLFHTFLGSILVIHYQENPGTFLSVEIKLKGILLPWQETDMRAKEIP